MSKKRGNSEGSIVQRKDGRGRTYYGKTRQEAAQKLLQAQKAISDGLPPAA